MTWRILPVVPAAILLGAAAPAPRVPADRMLVASTPGTEATIAPGLARVTLRFAEPVRLLDVTIRADDDSGEITVFEADHAQGVAKRKATEFALPLPAPLTARGRYSLSYLLTSRSHRSLNGFVYFTVGG